MSGCIIRTMNLCGNLNRKIKHLNKALPVKSTNTGNNDRKDKQNEITTLLISRAIF